MVDRVTRGSDAERQTVSEDTEIRPVAVKPREGYRVWLRYSDGEEGEVDLSHLVGKGVFKVWDDAAYFRRVHLTDYDAIAWDDDLELCPDALYLELTGKSLAELMPMSVNLLENA